VIRISCFIATECSGSAAVEFALVVPVMVSLWLGSVEVSRVVQADMQLYNAAEAAANVAANQLNSVREDITSVDNFCNGAKLAMYPFLTAGSLSIAIASVTNRTTITQNIYYNDANYTYFDKWAVDWTNGATVTSGGTCAAASASKITIPAAISVGSAVPATYQSMVPNPRDSVLVVQATYNYSFNIGYGLPSTFSLSQTVYTRPRNGLTAPQ
jgi:Flp pilus assembly protein TadG